MYICASDFCVLGNSGPIDVLDFEHVATQADGELLFNVTFLENGQIKQRLYSGDELRFTRKTGTE